MNKSCITKNTGLCAICGKRVATEEHHVINGNGLRDLADKDLLTLDICSDCHRFIHKNAQAEKLCKIIGQLAFEKNLIAKGETEDNAREQFRKRYSRSWL